MKRSTIIITSSVVVIILLAVWVYLLLFNTPGEAGERFANFTLFGDREVAILPPEEELFLPPPEPTVNVAASPLRQLTTRPVVGFVAIQQSSTTPEHVLYVEAGTGHIYRIDLESGEEIRVSNVTIPQASKAAFSPDASYVAIRSGFSNQNDVAFGSLDDTSTLSSQVLPGVIRDFAFSSRNELLFTEANQSNLTARALQPETRTTRTLFTVPFSAGTVQWSPDPSFAHHLYVSPASSLMGYFYTVQNGSIAREPIMSRGLMAIANSRFIAYNQLTERQHDSLFFDRVSREVSPSPIMTIPEKCTFTTATSSILYCGYQITEYFYTFPDDWHKGTRSFTDSIWEVDLETGSASQLINPLQVTGREIDIIHMTLAPNGDTLFFTNKNDRTLWMFRLSQ